MKNRTALALASALALAACGGGSVSEAEKQAFDAELADMQRQASLDESLKKRGDPLIINRDGVPVNPGEIAR